MKVFPTTSAMNLRETAVKAAVSSVYTRNAFAVDEEMNTLVFDAHESTYLPVRSRRSDTRSAGAVGSDADCREGSADAAVGRGME